MLARHDDELEKAHWDPTKPVSRLSAYVRASRWFAAFVRPSFLTRTARSHNKRVRETAWLDGLRGFAAFLVYVMHHQLWAHGDDIMENAYGHQDQFYFSCLPGIRMFFTGGHYAVTVFFVISGYVLSSKPLSLIHAGDYVKLTENLGSALFRRWLRLYIPLICTTFLYMSSWHAFGIWTDDEHQPTYRDELWNWYIELKSFTFVFRTGGEPWLSYNYHSWSIPAEFKGSILIYTSLMAFSKCTRNARLFCELGLVVYFMYIVDGWFCSMFTAGMLLCDLDMLARNDDLPRLLSHLRPLKDFIFYILLIVSIYLGGVPTHSRDVNVLKTSPGWVYLSSLKPQAVFDYKWFYLFWASTFLVAAIPRISWLKYFFETRFNQYLGRISYAFYLVHGPVLWTLGDRLYVAVGWSREVHIMGLPNWVNAFPMSKQGIFGLEPAFLLPQLILLPVTLWLAEIVTKLFDEPSVRFPQWLYGKTLAPPSDHGILLG